tara:strand:+ start:1073 stop:1906 length:834 start_codon:yes stop_codon:yes gene_type:complete
MSKPRYAKLMGDAWRNPKLARLSHGAFRLYVNAISYCADNLTDGVVPAHVMPALVPGDMPAALPVEELTGEHGLLLASDGGYRVCNFLEHNVSRQDIEKHSQMQRDKANKRWKDKEKKEEKPKVPTAKHADGNATGNAKHKYKNNHKNNSSHVWVVKIISEMYNGVFGTDWFGYAQYHTELMQFAEWAEQHADPSAAVRMACEGWSKDPYVIKQNYGPLPLLWRKAPQYYLAGVGEDEASKKAKLEELSRQEDRAYKEGNSAESKRLQEAIARLQQG